MTDRQRATVAFLAYVLKTNHYSADFNVKVYRYDLPNRYEYRFEKQFTSEYLSLKVMDHYLEITHEAIYHEKTGDRLRFFYKTNNQEFRMELETFSDKTLFEGKTPSQNKFYGEFEYGRGSSIETIKVKDPETDIKEYRYVVEF